jgi:hypothetical protein
VHDLALVCASKCGTGGKQSHEKAGEKFGAHRNGLRTKVERKTFLLFLSPRRQYFVWIYARAARVVKILAN